MAKVDAPDPAAFYMNPSAYSQVKTEAKKTKGSPVRKSGETSFSRIFDSLRAKTADEIGPLRELPVSEETVNLLMDEIRDAGDTLRNRPFPEEIMRYKQAVRNFMHYVVDNGYTVEHEAGIPKFLKPGYSGQRGSPESQERTRYVKVQVIDTKLEELAAMILSGQKEQLKLTARLEEINGLLIDLMQ